MSAAPRKQRLDTVLVDRGLAKSRSQARDLILRGAVKVAGEVVTKPGRTVSTDCDLAMEQGAGRFVSRGAYKLIAGLDAFGFDPEGRNALDIGSSTGGFTQVLLERGASHVTCVDVGTDQLAGELIDDSRVTVLEGLDVRNLTAGHLNDPLTGIVADVSFISLTKALPEALGLASPGCWLVALAKPQFEVGPGAVGRGGIVRGVTIRQRAVKTVRDWIAEQSGWRVMGATESPVKGSDGNREYLVGAVKSQ